jgi:TetR/AcrR family transcriptional repressor of nem operon
MKVTRQQADANRARVLRLASRRFRERGFRGVSVADLMNEAGLTHGGFYKQFASKEDLTRQACALGLRENLAGYQQLAAEGRRQPLRSIADGMLSALHRDVPAEGCVMAALGPDISRADPSTRHDVTQGIDNIVTSLSELIPGKSKAKKREKALAMYATIVGAVMLTRAVDEPELSEEILKAARAHITAGS